MLAPYAFRPEESRGRRYPEPRHRYRDDFQRDRDRVVHSRAFRRLEDKTQVFTRRYSDHFRNRLTHTIEVSQVSRTIAAVLGLNEDLVEALALVHDVGHPPFGHAGEHALDMAREKKPDVILLDMLLPKMTGPDVLKALKKDPETAGIAVVIFTGLSQKNAVRLQQDGACAFLEKSELGLEKGCETLLTSLAGMVRKLNLEVPAGTVAAR